MKKLKFPLFLVGILVALVACEQNYDFVSDSDVLEANEKSISELKMRSASAEIMPLYMALDSVPEWVKREVTSEQYDLWKILSSKYEIDYSFMKDQLTEKRKAHIYSGISRMCTDILNGKIDKPMGRLRFLRNQDVVKISSLERLSKGESGNFDAYSTTIQVYSHPRLDIRAKAVLSYSYNKESKEARDIDFAKPYVDADEMKFGASVEGESHASYNDYGYISISCGGTVKYYDNGVYGSDDITFSDKVYL